MAWHHKALRLLGSKSATQNIPNLVKWQLVLDQMAKDSSSRKGPHLICKSITFDTGIPLTRSVAMSVTAFFYLLRFGYF